MKTTRPPTGEGNKEPATKTAASPAPPRTLSEDDWNFDKARVSDAEVAVCCYWEYARESAFILSVRKRCGQMADLGLDFTQRRESIAADFSRILVLGPTAHLFQEGIYALGGTTLYSDAVSPFPQPWQSLPQEMRRILLETASWSADRALKIPAFRWSQWAEAVWLAKRYTVLHPPCPEPPTTHWFSSRMEYFVKGVEPAEKFWWGDKPRTERPSWMSASGEERLLVEIDWGRFTNEQIIACFRKWVRVHRPKGVKQPSGKGHGRGKNKTSDRRAALNRLGIMRALHSYSFADPCFPQPLKDRGEKTCYAARKKAGETFRKLFPFEQKNPIHWNTKGGKAR
jgi:hypothetical protein